MRTGARIYRHTDGRWEARYPKGRRPDGRIRYGSVYGGSYEEAGQRRAELLRSLPPEESSMTDGSRSAAGTARSRPAYPEPLTEADVRELLSHAGHWSGQERLAVCLALCCGVSCEELAALRYSDVDLTGGALRISRRMTDARPAPGLLTYPEPRVLPLPETVMADAGLAELIRSGGDRFVLTDASVPVRSLRAARMLWGRLLPAGMPQRFTPEALRATFIRRALENGLNAETVSRITGLTVPVLRSKYGQYAGANPGLLRAMDGFVRPEDCRVRQMNLLILGAGSHGHAVYEIAERLGVFQKIAFLDDAVTGDRVIGKLEDCLRYREEYPACGGIPGLLHCHRQQRAAAGAGASGDRGGISDAAAGQRRGGHCPGRADRARQHCHAAGDRQCRGRGRGVLHHRQQRADRLPCPGGGLRPLRLRFCRHEGLHRPQPCHRRER